jgi:hypothetical protein
MAHTQAEPERYRVRDVGQLACRLLSHWTRAPCFPSWCAHLWSWAQITAHLMDAKECILPENEPRLHKDDGVLEHSCGRASDSGPIAYFLSVHFIGYSHHI